MSTSIPATPRLSPTRVPGIGPIPCRVMLVGEGPGKHEDARREPFVGPSGQLQTHILEQRCKPPLFRDEMYITNLIKRRIKDDDDPTPDEIALFAGELRDEVAKVQPEVIIAVGRFASQFFLPGCNLELQHGMPAISEEFGVIVVPCYHMYDTEMMPAVYWDYQRAAAVVSGALDVVWPEERPTQVHDRLPALIGNFVDPVYLGIDTEDRVDGSPWCLTVSWADGHAAWLPPGHPDLVFLDKVVRMPGVTTFIHHGMHDLSPLRKLGLDWADLYRWPKDDSAPRIIDTMQLAFQQGRLHTQALKTLVYRLLNVRMRSYADVVDPVANARALEYLGAAFDHRGWHKPEPAPYWDETLGKLRMERPQGAEQRLKRIVNDYIKAPETFDAVKRWDALPDAIQDEIVAALGPFPRTDLSHCDPVEAKHYACQDADMTRQLGRELWTRHQLFGLERIAEIDHGQIPMVERMQSNGLPAERDYFIRLGAEMREMQQQVAEVLSTLVERPFNPNSSDQVADLLFKQLGLESAKSTKSGKPSTGKKALEHLRKTNAYVDLIAMSREYGKIDSGFCGNIVKQIRDVVVGCEVDHLGVPDRTESRAFYQLMVTRAKTGRLASKNFNALAIPTRTDLGRRIRYGFKCRPGRLLGTWDLNQIEMRVMAHRADDPAMCEVYNRDPKKFEKWDRDLHIYTASQVTGIDPRDVPKSWRTACKSTGFGIIMGITEVGLADQMRMYGLDPAEWTEDRCAELIRDWLKVFRGVYNYQMEMRALARRVGEVRDMFGRRFLLPHASCPLSWIASEAERQSHALDIQSTAQSIEKLCMRRIDEEVIPAVRAMGVYCEPVLQVHDELILEFDEDAAPIIDALMLDALTTTVTLRVPIEAGSAMGPTWGDLEK